MIEARIAEKCHFVPFAGCHIWTGHHTAQGYGKISWNGVQRYVHRIAYQLAYGAIPPAAMVCHRCDTPSCCNPHHLFLGTSRDNIDDMVAKRRHQNGPSHYASKLSEAMAAQIESLAASGCSLRGIAEQVGLTKSTVHRFLKNQHWLSRSAA